MSFYISTSIIEASLWCFNRDDYYKKGEDSGPGYRFWNNDRSKLVWVSQEEFERKHPIKLENDQTISNEDVDNFIVSFRSWRVDTNKLVMEASLSNGSFISESYSSFSEDDWDEEAAKSICMRRLYEKARFLLSFLLQCVKLDQTRLLSEIITPSSNPGEKD